MLSKNLGFPGGPFWGKKKARAFWGFLNSGKGKKIKSFLLIFIKISFWAFFEGGNTKNPQCFFSPIIFLGLFICFLGCNLGKNLKRGKTNFGQFILAPLNFLWGAGVSLEGAFFSLLCCVIPGN